MAKSVLDWIAIILLIIGGLSWGLIALGSNIIEILFVSHIIPKIIYTLIALAAIYKLITINK